MTRDKEVLNSTVYFHWEINGCADYLVMETCFNYHQFEIIELFNQKNCHNKNSNNANEFFF